MARPRGARPRRFGAILILALLAGLLPATPASAAPTITFLNPSKYTDTTTLRLSDKADNDTAYHFVAWVQQVPANPVVEFELQAPAENAQTITATRVGSSDTWEAFFDIPTSDSDGQYDLRARLYSGASEVDNDEESVTVTNSDAPPTAAETLEITYPADGGTFGFFTPKGKATNGVVAVKTSSGARQARVFYTQSDPGNTPVWKLCGFGSVNQTTFTARIRCDLKEGDAPASVTAIGAVANRTPAQTEPNAGLDDTGDAHRITAYVQQPTSFSIAPQAQSVNPDKCTALTVATLLDQAGQPIAQANVDLHAVGPSDQLRFGEGSTNTTSGFQAPDKAHLAKELAIDCSNDNNGNSEINQGDHNVPGGDDIKHIESTGGTTNAGQFSFMLHADEVGSTTFTIWADVDDDDLPGSGEASGGGRIGWGQPAPPPVAAVALSPSDSSAAPGKCQKITLTTTEDGAAVGPRNVDLHVFGPDSTAQFCDAGNGMPRAPDQGGHTGYADPDGSIHGEGETDSSGQLVIGVTSGTNGNSSLTAWLDKTDDDVQGTDEPSTSGQITWKEGGGRTVSLKSNKSSVPSGSKVRLSGRVRGQSTCTGAQRVKLQSRKHGGGSFKGAGSTRTGSTGRFKFRKKVSRATDYRAIAPRSGSCPKAKSRVVTVRTG